MRRPARLGAAVALASLLAVPVLAHAQVEDTTGIGEERSVTGIDGRFLSSADTSWGGSIYGFTNGDILMFGAGVRDSTGRFRVPVRRFWLVVRHRPGWSVVQTCAIDSGEVVDSIVALARFPDGPGENGPGDVAKAWILRTTDPGFRPFPPDRVRCTNPWPD